MTSCTTCAGVGTIHCAAHVAGDGCDQLALQCPDCQPEADIPICFPECWHRPACAHPDTRPCGPTPPWMTDKP